MKRFVFLLVLIVFLSGCVQQNINTPETVTEKWLIENMSSHFNSYEIINVTNLTKEDTSGFYDMKDKDRLIDDGKKVNFIIKDIIFDSPLEGNAILLKYDEWEIIDFKLVSEPQPEHHLSLELNETFTGTVTNIEIASLKRVSNDYHLLFQIKNKETEKLKIIPQIFRAGHGKWSYGSSFLNTNENEIFLEADETRNITIVFNIPEEDDVGIIEGMFFYLGEDTHAAWIFY